MENIPEINVVEVILAVESMERGRTSEDDNFFIKIMSEFKEIVLASIKTIFYLKITTKTLINTQ